MRATRRGQDPADRLTWPRAIVVWWRSLRCGIVTGDPCSHLLGAHIGIVPGGVQDHAAADATVPRAMPTRGQQKGKALRSTLLTRPGSLNSAPQGGHEPPTLRLTEALPDIDWVRQKATKVMGINELRASSDPK